MQQKRNTVYVKKSTSGWLTLIKVILIAIAVGIALSKIYDRFLKKFVERQELKAKKSTAEKQAKESVKSGEAERESSASEVTPSSVAFEAPAENIIANIAELDDQ